jgi:hypothetical protein
MLVDRQTGELLAGDCIGSRPSELRLFTLYPPELVAWWRSQGSPVQEAPHPSPDCSGLPDAEPPRIVSPDAATPYHLRRDAPLDFQRIPLLAQASPGARTLYWYQDGALVATTARARGAPAGGDGRPGEVGRDHLPGGVAVRNFPASRTRWHTQDRGDEFAVRKYDEHAFDRPDTTGVHSVFVGEVG